MTALGVFFTRGVSLEKWLSAGLYDREVSIYRTHLRNGTLGRVYWFTYGCADAALAKRLTEQGRLPAEISVVPCPHWIHWLGRAASIIYTFLLPFLAARHLRQCDILKANQMEGAIAALLSSVLHRCPLFVRTGYTLSRIVETLFPNNLLRRGAAWLTEYFAFHYADKSSVSSRFDFAYVVKRYSLKAPVPTVMGNFVDTEAFAPIPHSHSAERMIFVGRLSPEKNLEMAIRACQLAGIGLDIVGQGSERQHLESLASELKADVKWLGVVGNDALPQCLSHYKYFILPSLWEGMPKALMEAMACGLVCIGNNTTGINEIIQDGVTGYLSSGPSAPKLAEAINRARQGDCDLVSAAAREFICSQFSLAAIAAIETEIFAELLHVQGGKK